MNRIITVSVHAFPEGIPDEEIAKYVQNALLHYAYYQNHGHPSATGWEDGIYTNTVKIGKFTYRFRQ